MVDVQILRLSSFSKVSRWIFATTVLLLFARDGSACQWIVDRCVKDSPDQCKAALVWAETNGVPCSPFQNKSVLADASHPCSTDTCSFLMSWCTWSDWNTRSSAKCGEEAGRQTRTRAKCCHPVTMKRYSYSPCPSTATETQTRTVEYDSCVNPYYVAAGIVALLLIIVAVFIMFIKCDKMTACFRDKCLRRGERQPESQPPMVLTQVQAPAVDPTLPPTYDAVVGCENPSFEASKDDLPPKFNNSV